MNLKLKGKKVKKKRKKERISSSNCHNYVVNVYRIYIMLEFISDNRFTLEKTSSRPHEK